MATRGYIHGNDIAEGAPAVEFKSIELKEAAFDLSKRIIEGYAATWDRDQTNDIIHKGAFTKSIQEAFPAGRIKMLWQHYDPLGMPIEMREDDTGLYVKGRVSRTQLGDDALELMRDRVVDRMSIGFVIPKDKATWSDDGTRHIHEIKLLEFSPVTFPANEAALITGVKSLREQIQGAKARGIELRDYSEFVAMIDELKALFQGQEPGAAPTPPAVQPLDLSDAMSVIKSLGEFARKL